MKAVKLTKAQGDTLVEKVRGCVQRSRRYCRKPGLNHDSFYPHLVGGLQGVLEEIEPRLFDVFREEL